VKIEVEFTLGRFFEKGTQIVKKKKTFSQILVFSLLL